MDGGDVAVRWSEYEQHRGQLESEIRHKIAADIEFYIKQSRANGLSNHFVSGLELAKDVASGLSSPPKNLDQPSLF